MSKKKVKNPYPINEYDEDPVKLNKARTKKKRRKKLLKILLVLLVIALIAGYFVTDISRIQKITIKGNNFVTTENIEEEMDVQTDDYRIFTFKSNIKSKVTAIPGIKSVSIKKNIIQGLVVTVKEENVVAFVQNSKGYRLIYDTGEIGNYIDASKITDIQIYPSCTNFTDEDDLETFAKSYVQVKAEIRSQFSDISYSNEQSDPHKITIITNDGRTIYCRIKDMVSQLNSYNNLIQKCPDKTIFDFHGDNVYMK